MLNYHVKRLATMSNTIALEDTIQGNFKNLVANIIPSIIGSLGSVFNEYKKNDAGAIPPNIILSRKNKTFVELVSNRPYMTISEITLYVPEGLKVGYLEYIQKLTSSVSLAEYTVKELMEYSIFIGKLVNDKNFQLSTEFIDAKVNELKTAIDHDKKEIGECFEKGSTRAEVKYKTLMENNSSWPKIISDMETLMERVNKIDKKAINEKIESISVMLEVILKKIHKGELDDASPAVVSKMGEYTYIIALLLELLSITSYRVMVLSTAITESIEKVTKIINAK